MRPTVGLQQTMARPIQNMSRAKPHNLIPNRKCAGLELKPEAARSTRHPKFVLSVARFGYRPRAVELVAESSENVFGRPRSVWYHQTSESQKWFVF